jgi:SAM-dependent methyltransferase
MTFKDHFSAHSTDYAKYRPRYPDALFAYLASVTPHRQRAWDCATGNGQAALGLVPYFDEIIATDASQAQLENAVQHDKIVYQRVAAEHTNIGPQSVGLITVAQAFHWLDRDGFYREVRRVLKPGGALAVWCYIVTRVSPEINELLDVFYRDIVGPYWPPERRLTEDGYRSVPFPFQELGPPPFEMQMTWTLPDLLGYLRTWSATQRYIKAHGVDPVVPLAGELVRLWGPPEQPRPVRWPVGLRVGVVTS